MRGALLLSSHRFGSILTDDQYPIVTGTTPHLLAQSVVSVMRGKEPASLTEGLPKWCGFPLYRNGNLATITPTLPELII
jgi:hypothetical protein